MEFNVIKTTDNGERVSSAYTEIYFDENYCHQEITTLEDDLNRKISTSDENQLRDEWTSPSDLLIDIIELKPPFTSKITRGKTHEGILAIGDNVLKTEQEKFIKELTTLIHENDAAWNHILEHEKQSVINKINEVYQTLLQRKNKVMTKEIATFYENSLQELEDHVRSEVQKVLISVHARIISNLNIEIKGKLKKEKNMLEKILKRKYKTEEEKVQKYYKLLLQNEVHRNNTLVRSAVSERNEALKAFFQQFEMENITNTMYVMSTERKKCKIKKFFLENIHDVEIAETLKKINERQKIIDSYNEGEVLISDANKEWEEKIKKILQLFLKFISFTFKLLPEQSTFLVDFEKMVILQLNEIIHNPHRVPSILVDGDGLDNTFRFEHLEEKEKECGAEPIYITGNLEDPTPPRYGSRETLASDVDLPTIRLQRQFIYAKCHKYEEIKKLLESQRCKCRDVPSEEASLKNESIELEPTTPAVSESSDELLLVDDIKKLHECPIRKCTHWAKRHSSPFLEHYLDFSEENFKIVEGLLEASSSQVIMPELIDVKSVVQKDLPFGSTKERYHTIETQYSSQENLYMPTVECTCTDNYVSEKQSEWPIKNKPADKSLNNILMQRRNSIKMLLYKHASLHKIFTDESFDFVI